MFLAKAVLVRRPIVEFHPDMSMEWLEWQRVTSIEILDVYVIVP